MDFMILVESIQRLNIMEKVITIELQSMKGTFLHLKKNCCIKKKIYYKNIIFKM